MDLTQETLRIERPGDILELAGRGFLRVVLLDTQFREDFFDLSSGFAGDVVQKCVNYGIRVAVVRTSDRLHSTSFEQFASESTRQRRFIFVRTVEEARDKLGS